MITLKKKKRQIKLESVVLLFFALVMTGILAVSNYKIYQRRRQLLSKVNMLESEIEMLREENEGLKQGISQVSEQGYLEKEAVERFNLKPPGSQVVVVKEEEANKEEQEEEKGFWQGLLEKIGIK